MVQVWILEEEIIFYFNMNMMDDGDGRRLLLVWSMGLRDRTGTLIEWDRRRDGVGVGTVGVL